MTKLHLPGLAEYPLCKVEYLRAKDLLESKDVNRKDLLDILHTLDDNPSATAFVHAEFGGDFTKVYDRLREISQSALQSQNFKNVIFDFMPRASTYAIGVHDLRAACEADPRSLQPQFKCDDGTLIYRQLTSKENLQAMVEDYNRAKNPDGSLRSDKERLHLFTKTYKDSCTGVAYKGGSSKFKIVPVSKELVEIAKGFNQATLLIDYASIAAPKLDRSKGKYNQHLTKNEIVNHEAWRAAVEDDVALLTEYRDIVFTAKGDPQKLMGFFIMTNPDEDQLRALYVSNMDYEAYADC